MKKLMAIMALVAFTFAVTAGEGCCPAGGKDDKAKSDSSSPAGGEKKADDKKA
jgi:hypothetical protein